MIELNKPVAGALLLAASLSLPVAADDLVSAATDMCEKVKSCALAQMEGVELTPETRQMMEPMLASMCDQMRQGIGEVPAGHALYEPAVGCMRSLASLGCDAFQRENGVETAECLHFRELAEPNHAN